MLQGFGLRALEDFRGLGGSGALEGFGFGMRL